MRISDWSSDVCSSDLRYPAVAILAITVLDGGPGDAVGGFLLPRVADMALPGGIEGGAENLLRMLRQMVADRIRQIAVAAVGHVCLLRSRCGAAVAARGRDRKSTRLNSSH